MADWHPGADVAHSPGSRRNNIGHCLALGLDRLVFVVCGVVLRIHFGCSQRSAGSGMVRSGINAAGGTGLNSRSQTPRNAGVDLFCHDSDAAFAELAGIVFVASWMAAGTNAINGARIVGVRPGQHHGAG